MKKLLCVIVFVLGTFGLTGCGIGGNISNDIEDVIEGIADAIVTANDNCYDSTGNPGSTNYLFKGADISLCKYKSESCVESPNCAVRVSFGKVGIVECKDKIEAVKFAGTISKCYFAGELCEDSQYCVTEARIGNIGIIDCSI
jgi:metal-sulfur cluster biosynthetic enzyme